MPSMTSLCSAPTSERGVASPSAIARNVVPGPSAVSVRSSQPVWVAVVAVPRSRQSWAWKWLRLASGEATACTAAIWPAVQNGCSGASAGCRPKRESPRQQRGGVDADVRPGPAQVGVAGRHDHAQAVHAAAEEDDDERAGVVLPAAKAYCVVTSWVPSAATPTAPAPAMTRRRVNPCASGPFAGPGRRRPVSACTRIAASGRFGPCRQQAPSSSAVGGSGRRSRRCLGRTAGGAGSMLSQSWPHRSAW